MFKVSHTTMIVLSGLIWLAVGSFLLPLGLNFIVQSILKENLHSQSRPLLDFLAPFTRGIEGAALFAILFGLILGYTKGCFIFAKTVHKGVDRIVRMPNPTHLKDIYTKKYYILLGSMVFIGFLFRFATLDIRGFVDIVIGSALIHGAILYFRLAFRVHRNAYNPSVR
jgi:hypothetical protein